LRRANVAREVSVTAAGEKIEVQCSG